jgi:dCMP deaminase
MKFRNLINESIVELYVKGKPKEISMHDIYMNLAVMLSFKSTCKRGQAGCVVTHHGRIISTGYNGSPDHMEECISRENCRQQGSKVTVSLDAISQPREIEIKTDGCFDSIHGEANAFGFCSKHGIKTEGSVVYLTGPPCKSCSQLMVAAGVKTIYYNDKFYRNDDGILYAKIYGIELIKMEAA